MKQRRRMLTNLINLENSFLNAVYVASAGNDSSTSGYARISTSLLLNNKKYYLFGYYKDNFAIFTYFNGTITKIYEHSHSATLNVDFNYVGYCSLSANSDYTKYSLGLTALSFGADLDNIFAALSDEFVSGYEENSASIFYITITNIYKGETKYIFNGISSRFCVYKAVGSVYSDLTPLFNHNLYLISLSGTSITSSYDNLTAANHYGYTVFAAKE